VVLDGVPNAGRTALLDRAVELADQAGLLVMRASCSPVERELAGSVLTQLLHSVPVRDALTESSVPASHEFCLLVHRLAAETSLLIAVDDLHDGDEESVRSLLYLARRIGSARVLLVLTCEREGIRPVPGFVGALLDEPCVQRIDVEPLSVDGVAGLLAEELGTDPAATRLAAEFHRVTGGNPGLLQAMVDDHRGASAQHLATGAPVDLYAKAVVRLLERGDVTTIRIASALAVLGDRATHDRVARLAGFDGETGAGIVESTIAALNAVGLLRRGRFPHPAARSAVRGMVAGEERVELNLRAAELLHTDGEPATAIACHLTEAGLPVESWAVPVLVEAADQLLAVQRNEGAARYLELATTSCRRPAERAPVLARYTSALWLKSPLAAVGNLTQLVDAEQAGHLDRTAAGVLVHQLLWHGRGEEAAAVAGRLHDTGDVAPAGIRGMDSWLAYTYAPLTGRRPARAQPSGTDPDVVPPTGADPGLVSAAAIADLLRRGQTARQVEHLEQVLHHLRPSDANPWVRESAVLALFGLLAADRVDQVVDWCARLTTPADAHRASTWHAEVTSVLAEALLRRGDLADALTAAKEALTVLPARAWGAAVGLPLGTLITAAVRSGDLAEAARHLPVVPPEATFHSRYGLYYLYARGEYHLATERAHAAVADFTACGDLVRVLGLDAASTVPWRVGAARAWLSLDKAESARRLVRDELTLADAAGGSRRAGALRMLAAVSRPERRPALLQEAVELFEECGDRYGQAQALADLGRAFSALDDGRRTRAMLRRARHLASFCDAAPLCDELFALLEPPEPRAPREDGDASRLTESEWRVAHLAVLGYTNREIAAKLYVTSSTVEQHLTRVFRKLDVKRRKDLPADLGTSAVRTPPARRPQSAAQSTTSR
jgi:DNA-binding CsgD family transcriptional regulator